MRMSWLMRKTRFMIHCDCSDEDVSCHDWWGKPSLWHLVIAAMRTWLMRKTRFMMHYDCSNDENDGWWEKPRFIIYCGSSSEGVMIHEENPVCVLTSGMRMWWSVRKTWFLSWLQWWGCNDWGGKTGLCCVLCWQIRLWSNNPDQFVEDEDEDSFSYSVRISAQDLLLVSNYLSFYNNRKFYLNSWWAPHFEMIPKRCGHK